MWSSSSCTSQLLGIEKIQIFIDFRANFWCFWALSLDQRKEQLCKNTWFLEQLLVFLCTFFGSKEGTTMQKHVVFGATSGVFGHFLWIKGRNNYAKTRGFWSNFWCFWALSLDQNIGIRNILVCCDANFWWSKVAL